MCPRPTILYRGHLFQWLSKFWHGSSPRCRRTVSERRRRRSRRLVKTAEFVFYKRNSRLSRCFRYDYGSKNVFKLNMQRRLICKWKYEKLAVIVHVLLGQRFTRTCTTIVLIMKPFVLVTFSLPCRRGFKLPVRVYMCIFMCVMPHHNTDGDNNNSNNNNYIICTTAFTFSV